MTYALLHNALQKYAAPGPQAWGAAPPMASPPTPAAPPPPAPAPPAPAPTQPAASAPAVPPVPPTPAAPPTPQAVTTEPAQPPAPAPASAPPAPAPTQPAASAPAVPPVPPPPVSPAAGEPLTEENANKELANFTRSQYAPIAPGQPTLPNASGVPGRESTVVQTYSNTVAEPGQSLGPEFFTNDLKEQAASKPPATGAVIDMTKPLDVNEMAKHLGPGSNLKPEEQKQILTDLATKLKTENPQYYEGFADIQAGRTDTEAAKAYQGRLKQGEQEFIQQRVQADPQKASTPLGFGEIVNNAMSIFQSMPLPLQAMVGIGLPVGLIGIMSGLFGRGGVGMGILGALGLGAGVLGGAAGGLFGEGAQKGIGDLSYNVGQFLGMIPEGQQDLSTLMADDPVQTAVSQSNLGFGSPTADVKAKVQDALAKKQQIQSLINAPVPDNLKVQWLMKMDPVHIKTPEDAMRALRGAGTLSTAFDDANSPLAKKIQAGQAYSDGGNSVYGLGGRAVDATHGLGRRAVDAWNNIDLDSIRKSLPSSSDVWNTLKSTFSSDVTTHDYLQQYIQPWAMKRAFNDMDAKELSDLKAEKAKGAPYRVDSARREHELNLRNQAKPAAKKTIIIMCMKSARCWAGYEPVPGKKPYSNDSCRPVGSKKKTDKKKKATT